MDSKPKTLDELQASIQRGGVDGFTVQQQAHALWASQVHFSAMQKFRMYFGFPLMLVCAANLARFKAISPNARLLSGCGLGFSTLLYFLK